VRTLTKTPVLIQLKAIAFY